MTTFRDQLQHALGDAYTLERELGGGGMSHVYIARERALDRSVVVKVLAPQLAAGVNLDRFLLEVKLSATLQDAHIVPVLAAGDAAGLPWFTMPYVAGDSLRDRLRCEPRLPLAESVSVLRGVLIALAAAHEAGVIHRDIKPENVLLSRSGTPMVTDFGIAKAVSAARTVPDGSDASAGLTQLGMSIGTPAYMAPEQAAGGAVDQRADLYSWAVVAYELLAGAHPFAGKQNAQQLVAAHLMETPPSLAARAIGVPNVLVRLVERTLSKAPTDRPATARALLEQFDEAMRPPPARTSRGARTTIVASVLVAAVASGVALWSRDGRAATSYSSARVVVAPFDNRTADSTLTPVGAMAADWIARGLTETGLVDIAPQPAGALTGDSILAYARRERAGTVLSGSFYRSGDSLQFVAVLTDVGGKTQFEAVAPVAASPKNPMAALEQLRRRVAGALAARLDPSADVDRMGGGVPPSFEAYRAVLAARGAPQGVALQRYQEAGALDSTWGYPLLEAADIALLSRRYDTADTILMQLSVRRPYFSAWDQARFDELKGRAAIGSDVEAVRKFVLLAPRSAGARFALVRALVSANRMGEASREVRAVDTTRMDRPFNGYWQYRTFIAHRLGDYAGELEAIDRGRDGDSSAFFSTRARALAALGRIADLDALTRSVPTGVLSSVYCTAIAELDFHGHAADARALSARFLADLPRLDTIDAESIRRTSASLFRSSLHANCAASILAMAGRREEAERRLDAESTRIAEDPQSPLRVGMRNDVPLFSLGLKGVIAAHAGDRVTAERIQRQLVALRPERAALPTALVVRATIAAQLGKRDESIALLRDAIAAGATFRVNVPASHMSVNSGLAPERFWFAPLRNDPEFVALMNPRR